MSSLGQDVRYALRWFARSPGFTAVAVLTLALGIGANTAMFAVVNAVLLKPLPFEHADRLMLVHLLVPLRDVGDPSAPRRGQAEMVWSYPKYKTLTDLQQVFEDTAIFTGRPFSLSGDGDPERVPGETITDQYLSVLGVRPLLGRTFTPEEARQAGAVPVAMIGHGLWTRRYGADPGVLGRALQLGGVTHTIVGVLPLGFRGLSGDAELWTPLAVTDPESLTEAHSHSYSVIARRRPEVAETAVVSALGVYGKQVEEAHRDGPRFRADNRKRHCPVVV